MNKTLIEWVKNPDGTQGFTWNPITGCNNQIDGICKGGNFPCYAYRLANGRLRGRYLANKNTATRNYDEDSYPFYPRFWPERLGQLPSKEIGVFVCDMSDLFGLGIPEEWTERTLPIIEGHPYIRFYLLTKQPQNLIKFSPFPDNCWVGVTATNTDMLFNACHYLRSINATVKYLSLEPFLDWDTFGVDTLTTRLFYDAHISSLIIGAWTGSFSEVADLNDRYPLCSAFRYGNKWTLQPAIEWVEEIIEVADRAGIQVFMKDNLAPLYASHYQHYQLRQEIPK